LIKKFRRAEETVLAWRRGGETERVRDGAHPTTRLIALAAVAAIQAAGGQITGVFTAIGAQIAAIPL